MAMSGGYRPAPAGTMRSSSAALVDDHERRLNQEMDQLLLDIRRIGTAYPSPQPRVLFGELFDDERVEQYYEALVGTLKSAKKRGIVDFKGQILFKGMHDAVVISIVNEMPPPPIKIGEGKAGGTTAAKRAPGIDDGAKDGGGGGAAAPAAAPIKPALKSRIRPSALSDRDRRRTLAVPPSAESRGGLGTGPEPAAAAAAGAEPATAATGGGAEGLSRTQPPPPTMTTTVRPAVARRRWTSTRTLRPENRTSVPVARKAAAASASAAAPPEVAPAASASAEAPPTRVPVAAVSIPSSSATTRRDRRRSSDVSLLGDEDDDEEGDGCRSVVSVSTAPPRLPPPPRRPSRALRRTSSALSEQASERVCEEISHLVSDIARIDPPGEPWCRFGELFDDEEVQQRYEALVGTLKSAKRRGVISFRGQMLLKGMHDGVKIEIVQQGGGGKGVGGGSKGAAAAAAMVTAGVETVKKAAEAKMLGAAEAKTWEAVVSGEVTQEV